MKKLIAVIVILAFLFCPTISLAGSYTTHGYFYKPAYRESGSVAYVYYNAALDATDAIIYAASTGLAALGVLTANWISTVDSLTLIQTAPSYSDNHTFTLAGDYSAVLTVGKRIVADCGADGLLPNTIVSCTYAAPTSTVVVTDSNLTANLAAVSYYATRNGINTYGSGDIVASEYGTPSWATFQTAVALANAAGRRLLITPGAWPISDTIEVTAPVKALPGVVLTIATTKTLTFSKDFEAGLYQVFSCTGTGKVTFTAGSNVTIIPQWWGASPSASAAVNTAAIQASLTALSSYTSWTLPPGEYNCNAALTVNSDSAPIYGLEMDFTGKLLFDSCSGLDIRYVRYSNIKGVKVKRLTQAWDVDTTTADFGVRFGHCRRSNIGLESIENFTKGFELDGATGVGNSYLTFNLGYIAECKYGQYVSNAGTGWNNECSYYGGQFTSNYTGRTDYTNVSIANDTLTNATAWPATFVTGFAVYVTSNALDTQDIPDPLEHGTVYYIIKVDAAIIKLATSYANAMAGTAIDLTSQGTCANILIGKAGSWGVKFTSSGVGIDNHRYYNSNFEALHNGCDFGGYTKSFNFLLQHPRFEQVANYIENAPRNLIWVQGAQPLGRTEIMAYCPRMSDADGKSIVNITSSGYADLDSYLSKAMPKDAKAAPGYGAGGVTFYNPLDLWQTTNWRNQVKTYFTLQQEDEITDYGSDPRSKRITLSYPMNKGFEGTAGPTTATAGGMTYAKNAVVWNTNVAAGQPMGWVCSKSGSAVRGPTVSAVGNVTGTTLTMTTADYSKYFFVGAFILINGVQHQIMKEVSWDAVTGLAVWTLYANNLGGDVVGATVANDPPTWIPMVNLVTTPTAPAVPASTVEQRNTNAYPVRITVIGGTVTVIAKGPTSGALITTGASAGAFILQPMEYIAITYSVAPTWTWTGM